MTDLLSRRAVLRMGLAAAAAASVGASSAQAASIPFDSWVERFRSRARSRGISDATYTRVMSGVQPDKAVFALQGAQPEFKEELWQYLNRRVSDWRITTGIERAKEYERLLGRVENDYGIDRYVMLGLWGMESAFGDVVLNPKHMRPVIPALSALAWGEPRRRTYWEQELLNALVIIERGWIKPEAMMGSWAGAMGHTQWMPEVWLSMGVDYNGDGRVSPYSPEDALAGTARYLIKRGNYRRGEHWGYEVRLPEGMSPSAGGMRPVSAWHGAGVKRADGEAFKRGEEQARLWQPVARGPVFLITRNFQAVKSYNPANAYTLAILHLGDRVRGAGPFSKQFPGGERPLTLPEVQEVQRRLTKLGFDTGGTDGRVGRDTMVAVRNFQRKAGLAPADGYAGLAVLAKLRQGG
jgi:membrane-bound lytic murein transglycosylase B